MCHWARYDSLGRNQIGLNSCFSRMLPHTEIPSRTEVTTKITTLIGFLTITFEMDLKTLCKMFRCEKLLGLKFLCLMQGIVAFLFSSILL